MVKGLCESGETAGQVHRDEFDEYVRRVRPVLHHSLFLLCGDWYLADDLIQQTMIVMYRHWDAIHDHAARTAYARKVMVRLLAREVGSAHARREQPDSHLPDDLEPDRTDELADRLLVESAVVTLSSQQRAAVVLRYWACLSTDEIARLLACPAGTVRSTLCRALVKMRAELQP